MNEIEIFFLIWILSLPITLLALYIVFWWSDFMNSLKVRSFFYTRFGFRFKTVERIQDFGAYVIACSASAICIAPIFIF
jgi:hypothetical protein